MRKQKYYYIIKYEDNCTPERRAFQFYAVLCENFGKLWTDGEDLGLIRFYTDWSEASAQVDKLYEMHKDDINLEIDYVELPVPGE